MAYNDSRVLDTEGLAELEDVFHMDMSLDRYAKLAMSEY